LQRSSPNTAAGPSLILTGFPFKRDWHLKTGWTILYNIKNVNIF